MSANAPMGHGRRVWIDVGAHHGEHSIAAAANDPSLAVHAFEPLPHLHDKLVQAASPNFFPHAIAVSDVDGVARFRINSFDAASSLLPLDEAVRATWIDGHLLHEEREIVVPTTRLDTFMREQDIARIKFLKIDAQGADFSVVRSLGDRIEDVWRIKLEVCARGGQLYRGAADKATIVAYMAERGFVLESTEIQSHGQEENLTFAALAGPFELQNAGEKVVGLYDPKKYALVAGTARWSDNRLEVTTLPAQWAYTAVIPHQPAERTRRPHAAPGACRRGGRRDASGRNPEPGGNGLHHHRDPRRRSAADRRVGRPAIRRRGALGHSQRFCPWLEPWLVRVLGYDGRHTDRMPRRLKQRGRRRAPHRSRVYPISAVITSLGAACRTSYTSWPAEGAGKSDRKCKPRRQQ
jgi:FkbM family methyltransferase